MSSHDVSNMARIANVRIYVEQAFGRNKNYHILSTVMPMNSVPLCDDKKNVALFVIFSDLYVSEQFKQ